MVSADSNDHFIRNLNMTGSLLDVMVNVYGGNFGGGKCEQAVAFLQKVAPDRMSVRMISWLRQADGCRWKTCEIAARGSGLRSSCDIRVSQFVFLWCGEVPS